MKVPQNLLYTKEHEWILIEGNKGRFGITDYAQSQLGDVTYVELPARDKEVEQFKPVASVESVKAASDVYAPLSGRIIEVNDELSSSPEQLNNAPYEKGWIAVIEIKDESEKKNLMDDKRYREYLESKTE